MNKSFAIAIFITLLASLPLFGASTRIEVEINGSVKSGRLYYDHSSNSHGGKDYLHLERLRARVGRIGYNIGAQTDIDLHVCELLGYSEVDYRIIGFGGYEDAQANIVREKGKNVIRPYSYDRRSRSRDFPIESMTCARPSI